MGVMDRHRGGSSHRWTTQTAQYLHDRLVRGKRQVNGKRGSGCPMGQEHLSCQHQLRELVERKVSVLAERANVEEEPRV
jgi:hypothetical protein